MRKEIRISLACVGVLVGSCWVAKADQPADQRFAGTIQQEKTQAAAIRNEFGDLANSAQTQPVFTAADIALAKKYFETNAGLWESAADAYSKGDQKTAQSFVHQGERMDRQRHIWFDRMQWRIKAGELAPNEEMYNGLARDKTPTALPAVARLIAARKVTAEAYEALADAIVPSGDLTVRDALTDRAYNAEIESDIALMQFFWAVDDGYWRGDPTIDSPQLKALHEQIDALRRERIDDYRKQKMLERQVQKDDEQSRRLNDRARELYYRAMNERNNRN